MGRYSRGLTTLTLATAFAIPTLFVMSTAAAKTTAKTDTAAPSSDQAMSKEDQAKLREHNKLRNEIVHVKYPASKAEVVAHVKGIKADDKKWFEETLPDRTFSSSDEVMSALGWETAQPGGEDSAMAHPQKSSKSTATAKREKPAN